MYNVLDSLPEATRTDLLDTITKKQYEYDNSIFDYKAKNLDKTLPESFMGKIKNKINKRINRITNDGKRSFSESISRVNDSRILKDLLLKLEKKEITPLQALFIRDPALLEGSQENLIIRILKDSDYGITDNMPTDLKNLHRHTFQISDITEKLVAGDFDGDMGKLILTSFDAINRFQDNVGKLSNWAYTTDEQKKLILNASKDGKIEHLKRFLVETDGDQFKTTSSFNYVLDHVFAKDGKIKSEMFESAEIEDYITNTLKITDTKEKEELIGTLSEFYGKTNLNGFKVLVKTTEAGKQIIDKENSKTLNDIIEDDIASYTKDIKLDEIMKKSGLSKQQYSEQLYKYKTDVISPLAASRQLELKKVTPEAYKLAKRFQSATAYTDNLDVINFLNDAGDKMIAQQAISAKHGNPAFLGSLTEQINKILNGELSEETVEKFLKMDFNMNISTTEQKTEIQSFLGGEVKDLSMSDYGRYLNLKESKLQSLISILEAGKTPNQQDISFLKNTVVESIIPNSHKHIGILSGELSKTNNELQTLKKTMTILGEPNRDVIKQGLSAIMKTKSSINALEPLTKFSEYGSTIFKSIANMFKYDKTTSHSTMVQDLSNTIGYGQQVNSAKAVNATKKILDNKLNKNIESAVKFSMKNTPTAFGERGLFSTIANSSNKLLLNEMGESISRKISSNGLKYGILGAITGAFMGQSINMMRGDYAVPGLENIAGKGGEYYENKGGIIRRTLKTILPNLEGIRRQKEVKVVNNDKELLNRLSHLQSQSIRSELSNQRSTTSPYSNSIMGVKV